MTRFIFMGSMLASCFAVVAGAVAGDPAVANRVHFNRDIRPILSDTCFACHGPDEESRQASLRLDAREWAIEVTDSGNVPIVPGEPDKSELIRRIFAEDEGERMPPAEAHKQLEPAERELLRQWIAQGAEYRSHWAYTTLRRPMLPQVSDASATASPIDQFIATGLAAAGVEPVAEADRVTLIRRLSLDLTGLPPTPDEVDAFVTANSADAYQRLVERLLASPRYGERMAAYWLDLVRFADTVGYHGDQDVSQSPFRDYVINAFNANLPYDRFVREQLAGDLLPAATLEQQIASGYNRLNQTTEEGGAQPKEYLAIYFADRVRNVSQVFLGATLGCAQCHDHKYDPFTNRDFYSFGAFFADLDEVGKYSARSRPPEIRLTTDEQQQQLEDFDARIGQLNTRIEQLRRELEPDQQKWEIDARERIDELSRQGLSEPIAKALRIPSAERTEKQANAVREYYLSSAPAISSLGRMLADLQSQRKAVADSILTTVVSRAVEPRPIRILHRGNWMDESGEIVEPAIPAFLGRLDTQGRRATRLDLADWLGQPDNPLTARTLVNRLWYLMFGRGICTSVDDLGGQGTFPSHPELLDWLATELLESGWNVKHVLRLIVTSEAYRRSSMSTPDLRARDSYNLLLARQGRFRIDAEMVRDSLLATSGLLTERIGGRSTKPYQPADYYAQLNFPKRTYVADQDDNQYRRGLYTHWQRTFLHPMFKAFDAPSREECTAARPRSSTPLQALTLLNDPTFVEAARVFASRILHEGGADTENRIAWAYHAVLSRKPENLVTAQLRSIYEQHLTYFRSQPRAAEQLIAVGQAPVGATPDRAELAAWTSVARVVFNLHETIMRY